MSAIIGAALVGGAWFLTDRDDARCAQSLISRIRCEDRKQYLNPEYETTRNLLLKEIDQAKAAGLSDTALYFRDLRNGPAFSIESGKPYLAMSLFKLPIAFRYLKDSESDPGLLDREIKVTVQPTTINQNFPIGETLENGKSYTIRTLLERMLKYSDNNSRAALFDYYGTLHPNVDIIRGTLEDLGVLDPTADANVGEVSLKSVTSLIRILYDAAYLSPENSELALKWLSESAYDDGIAKPIPSSIRVANKYGLANFPNEKQLHDCGIIYYPHHPYILCILTRGKDLMTLQNFIQTSSKIVYTEVDHRFGEHHMVSGAR